MPKKREKKSAPETEEQRIRRQVAEATARNAGLCSGPGGVVVHREELPAAYAGAENRLGQLENLSK